MTGRHVPMAVPRTRRSASSASCSRQEPASGESVAETPRRNKKTVRFSDPGPGTLSSGLTPFVRRTSLATSQPRRSSTTPQRHVGNGCAAATEELPLLKLSSSSGRHLDQTVDGRVQRRQRRNGMRDLLNKMEQEEKRKVRAKQSEIRELRGRLEARDKEIHQLRNTTAQVDASRVGQLEQQVASLRRQLDGQSVQDVDQTRAYDWTWAARDPFDGNESMDLGRDEEHFGDHTMAQFSCSTPSRPKTAFPTPPDTSPAVPMTPCSHLVRLATPSSHAAVQVCLDDAQKEVLEDELASLHLEVAKLTATLDSYQALAGRIAHRVSAALASSPGVSARSDPTINELEEQLNALLRAMSDRAAALAELTSAISDLGFPGNDAGDMITALASGFRAARLELEYLTPGEITLPLTSHGAEVLDLLLQRLRDLAKKAQEDEAAVDEYHELEQSLRKQLDARVSAMDALQTEMARAEARVKEGNSRIRELEVGNDRLRGAVDGYARDMAELERLVERMDRESQEAAALRQTQQDESRAALSAQSDTIAQLEAKLKSASERASLLQKQTSDLQDSQRKQVVALNRRQGKALALRDARVAELRGEIERVNASLRAAHETIRQLRVDNGKLGCGLEEEKGRAQEAIDSMKQELLRALETSRAFLGPADDAHGAVQRPHSQLSTAATESAGLLSGDLARRGSKKKRRRYDSGLGFLDEDEVDI